MGDFETHPAGTKKRLAELEQALTWYRDAARDCRKITSEGEAARNALDRDGGQLAENVLAGLNEKEPSDG